jgi:hypothetical protein
MQFRNIGGSDPAASAVARTHVQNGVPVWEKKTNFAFKTVFCIFLKKYDLKF